jgi:hypothetical protein
MDRFLGFFFDRTGLLWLLLPIGLVNLFVLEAVEITIAAQLPRVIFGVPALLIVIGAVAAVHQDEIMGEHQA